MDYDEDYRAGLAAALFETLITYSKGDADMALVKGGPAFDALMMLAAFVIAPSPILNSPQAIRLFCDGAAKELRKQIAAVQADPDAGDVFQGLYDPARAN